MIARTLLAIGLLLSGVGLAAQSADTYLQLVRMYRTDPAAAALSVSRLPSGAIKDGVRRCLLLSAGGPASGCQQADLLAGAMLHADAADLVIGPIGYAARDQIQFGRELLQVAINVATLNARINNSYDKDLRAVASFGGRWYALTARLLLAHGHFEVARLVAAEGGVRFPESPDLFVVLGLFTEWSAGLGWDAGDLRGFIVRGENFSRAFGTGERTSMPFRGTAQRDLEAAANNYRWAMAIDRRHAAARLRLAWVHLVADDRRVWEDVSDGFIKDAVPEAQFLAHLIRGTAAERERNAPSALAEYQAARLVLPDSQTACVAVSSAQALNRDFAGADATAAECLTLAHDPDDVDPWTLFRMGLMDTTTSRWLHDEARRP